LEARRDDGFRRLVADNIDAAELLAAARRRRLRGAAAGAALSVVCFRHLRLAPRRHAARRTPGRSGALEADGDGWLSTTAARLDVAPGRIVNPHTTPADIDRLIATLRRLAVGLP
jgi:hypothetical protein